MQHLGLPWAPLCYPCTLEPKLPLGLVALLTLGCFAMLIKNITGCARAQVPAQSCGKTEYKVLVPQYHQTSTLGYDILDSHFWEKMLVSHNSCRISSLKSTYLVALGCLF